MAYVHSDNLNTSRNYCNIEDLSDLYEYWEKFNLYQREIVAPRANVRCIKNK